MSRTHLMGAASAVALMLATSAAFAQESTTNIQGGGSTLAAADYLQEFATFDNAAAAGTAKFLNADADNLSDLIYWPAGSGTGQSSFLDNNVNEDCLKVTGSATACPNNTPGGINSVDYGASDATFNTTQISSWASSTFGQAASGNLIQLPSMGVGISIPVVNSLATQNGATLAHKPVAGGITLTDDDLCGIFSGKLTNWSQTSVAGKTAPGAITVVYRNDGSGTSFLLLNHFTAVCTASNSSFPVLPVVPSTTFTNVFVTTANPTGKAPSNFLGEKGSPGVANTLANVAATGPIVPPPITSAIGYLSPDFTSVDSGSDARLLDGTQSKLVVAGVKLGNFTYIPDVASVASALNHGVIFNPADATAPPTTAAAGAQTAAYVPLIETVSVGYPIVGYTTFDFAQCYTSATVTTGILNFLRLHFSTNATYAGIISRNGFVSIATSGARAFGPVIQKAILTNAKLWNDNIGNAKACAGLVGR